MAKARDMRSALGSSMRAEESRAIDRKLDRFARADAVLETGGAGKPENTNSPNIEHQRVIRDSFSLPANDYEVIGTLRERALKAGVQTNKSELIRAGLRVLLAMKEDDFLSAVKQIEKIKTGRPAEKSKNTV
jgi:Arc/MetJ-type ribon-helix-helix transcriptional regulator